MDFLIIALVTTAILLNWRRRVWKHRAKVAARQRDEAEYQAYLQRNYAALWKRIAEKEDVLEAEVIGD